MSFTVLEPSRPPSRGLPDGAFAELRPPLSPEAALWEANRCLACGGPHATAPCQVACPADVDVPGFIAAIADGRPAEGGRIVFDANPLGATCARVCPVEVMCEAACVLEHEGRAPIAIAQLQRFATDAVLDHWAVGTELAPASGRRVAIVGAGPAGLASAAELARLGHSATVYDERPEPGGLARYAIAPYRMWRHPLPAEVAQLRELGIQFEFGTCIDSEERLRRLEREYDAVLLAVGMGDDQRVDYPNQQLAGVWESLAFVAALKSGDLPRLGRRVVVVGGGNTAVDVAREAVRLAQINAAVDVAREAVRMGATQVTLVYRRSEAEMPAYTHEVDEARAEGVEFRFLTDPIRLLGDRKLEGVECQQMRLGPPDASGRSRPEPVEGATFVIPADTLVKAVGQQARSAFFDLVGGLELDAKRLRIDPSNGSTSRSKFFAAGDATNGGATVVEAVAEGKRAAHGVDRFLQGEQ